MNGSNNESEKMDQDSGTRSSARLRGKTPADVEVKPATSLKTRKNTRKTKKNDAEDQASAPIKSKAANRTEAPPATKKQPGKTGPKVGKSSKMKPVKPVSPNKSLSPNKQVSPINLQKINLSDSDVEEVVQMDQDQDETVVIPSTSEAGSSKPNGSSSSATNGEAQNAPLTKPKFEQIEIGKAVRAAGYSHAVHCFMYATLDKVLLDYDNCQVRAAIMIQLRFDGTFGFPGGMVDIDLEKLATKDSISEILEGVNRELLEEVNLDTIDNPVAQKDYLFSHKNETDKIMLHFYAYKMSLVDFNSMEYEASGSFDYGGEVQGICRVPLYTMPNGYHGLPAFLDNVFIGNARDQLLEALIRLKIMTKSEIASALASCRRNIM